MIGGDREPLMPCLSKIIIYPVKSLEGQVLPAVRVLRSGALADDRRYALMDAEGRYVNAKRFARIHLLRSTFDSRRGTLTLREPQRGPTTFHINDDRAALGQWVSEFFGFAVSLQENSVAGFPDDTDSPGPTLISTATLAEVASWFPGISVDQMRVRLRANLEIGGVPAFWEDQLYGLAGSRLRFQIGEVNFDGINPCQRCVVPPRDPLTGESYPGFSNTFRQRREQTLPEWAERSRFNHFYRLAINTRVPESEAGKSLRAGDAVVLCPAVLAEPTPAGQRS